MLDPKNHVTILLVGFFPPTNKCAIPITSITNTLVGTLESARQAIPSSASKLSVHLTSLLREALFRLRQ